MTCSLHKKINGLAVKRKFLPLMYFSTFGVAWIGGFVLSVNGFYWFSLMLWLILHCIGLIIFTLNENYWTSGVGKLKISFGDRGLMTYDILFGDIDKKNIGQRLPIIDWSGIWDYEFVKDYENVFVIFISEDMLDQRIILNLTSSHIQKIFKLNTLKYSSPIVIKQNDYQLDEFFAFIEHFERKFKEVKKL